MGAGGREPVRDGRNRERAVRVEVVSGGYWRVAGALAPSGGNCGGETRRFEAFW